MSVNEKTNYNEMMDKIMDKITNQITMLGTGNATVSQIYNTCFVLQTPIIRRRKRSLIVKKITPVKLPKTSRVESSFRMIWR